MSPSRGFKYQPPPGTVNPQKLFEDQQLAMGKIFAFAYVWALGGNLAHGVREEFDTFARERCGEREEWVVRVKRSVFGLCLLPDLSREKLT